MRDYPALSLRRWYVVEIAAVSCGVRDISFQLVLCSVPEQAGRIIPHVLPALLTPSSPLSVFLRDGLGITLARDESLDLTTLAGRRLEVQLAAETGDVAALTIAGVRCVPPQPIRRARLAQRAPREDSHGLE